MVLNMKALPSARRQDQMLSGFSKFVCLLIEHFPVSLITYRFELFTPNLV